MAGLMQESRDKARELLFQNNLESAVSVLQQAIKDASTEQDKSLGFCDIGSCYYTVGNKEEAKLYFKVALQKDQNNCLAWFNQAWLRMEEGDLEEAILGYGKAIEILPNFVDAYMNKGFCHLKQHNHSQEEHKDAILLAKECYKRAAELSPNNYDIYRTIGII